MTPQAYGYVAGSAGSESTAHANCDAFKKWRIVPRFLRNVLQRDLSLELFGQRLASPLLLGPVGVLSIVHPEAELAVAKAATALKMPFILSTAASSTIEDAAKASGDGQRWFQLYWPANQDLATSFVQRAEKAGYSAIVVTLDTYLLAWRERDLQNAYLPFLEGKGLANYFSDPVFQQLVGGDPFDRSQRPHRHEGRHFDRAMRRVEPVRVRFPALHLRLHGVEFFRWDDGRVGVFVLW